MRKHHKISLTATILVSIGIILSQVVFPVFTHRTDAISNKAFFTLGHSGNLQVGSIVTISVYINLDNNYNAANAELYYNNSRFQYVDATIGSKFNGGREVSPGTNSYGAYIKVGGTRTSGGPINGASGLAAIRFRMLSAGSAYANFGSKTVVMYPTTTYETGATNASYTVTNVPTPPQPPEPPTPPQPPTPRPPTTRPTTPAASAPKQSSASASGLQISDFSISEMDYRSALLTWKTNKPSTTKANYSTDKNDLYSEQKDDALSTDHRLKLEGDGIRAGKHYFVRITSDDGSGPVTIDGEFDTKSIPVVITVLGEDEQPAEGTSVTVGEIQGTTDANGEVALNLPEGEVTIFAEKDDLSQQIVATIEIPKDENPQRISLSLSKAEIAEITSSEPQKKSSPIGIILLILLIITFLGISGYFFWRRRQARSTYADPLEAENYSALPIPTTPLPDSSPDTELPALENSRPPDMPTPPPLPEPTYQELTNPSVPHHSSLPELVGRYGASEHEHKTPENISTSPSGQSVPHHSSLPEMVQIPNEHSPEIQEPITNDLPTSPVDETTKQSSHKTHSTDSSDKDGSLTIKH